MLVQLSVHEGVLNQRLAIVEDTIDLNGRNVLTQRGELALLNGADLALRIKHIDVDALYTEETVGDGRAGITTGSSWKLELLLKERRSLTLRFNRMWQKKSPALMKQKAISQQFQ